MVMGPVGPGRAGRAARSGRKAFRKVFGSWSRSSVRLGSSARPGRIAVLAAAGLVAFGYLLGGVDYVRLLRHTNRVRSEIARWEAQNERLREELKSVSSREYVEKVAKQELGLIYPDEKLYVVTQPGSSAEEAVQRRRSHEIEIGD